MTEDIYGKDPYQPSLWQRIKNWVSCHIRGRHHLPIYVSTGVYECSRCDYEQIEQSSGERKFTEEFIIEALEAGEVWYGNLDSSNYQSLDELTEDEGEDNQ